MANKKTLALTEETYKQIITAIREGFTYKDPKDGKTKEFKPNSRIATALVLEANLGVRVGDITDLSLSSFVKDGNRYRLNIAEEKTSKVRVFTVPNELYSYIQDYAIENGIGKMARLFPISERAIQKQLKIVADHLGLEGIGTHSFRKYYATDIYVKNNYNIELVRTLLQHSSSAITQRYIGIQSKEIEDAIEGHLNLL